MCRMQGTPHGSLARSTAALQMRGLIKKLDER